MAAAGRDADEPERQEDLAACPGEVVTGSPIKDMRQRK
jgi:hypothetical protein